MKKSDLSLLSPEQIEALIQWSQDPGARDRVPGMESDQGRVEVELLLLDQARAA